MIAIDFRIRPPAKSFLRTPLFTNMNQTKKRNQGFGMSMAPSVQEKSMSVLIAEMDEAEISQGVVPARFVPGGVGGVTNDEVSELINEYPGRFIGFGAVDLSNRHKALAEVDRAIKVLGFKGITIEPSYLAKPVYLNDSSIYPIYAKCEEMKIPVILMGGPDLNFTIPTFLDQVASDFPDLKIVVAHGAYPWVTEVLHVAFRRENVFVSPDMYLFNMPGSKEYIQAANYYLEDRFLFASSYPFSPLKGAVEFFRGLSLKEGVLEKVLHKNALRLLTNA